MDYSINRNTQAIMHIHNSSYYRSKILENGREYKSTFSPNEIINNSAIKNGSSMEGRLISVRSVLGFKSKIPLPISPFNNIYFFPTTSLRNKDCMWFSYYSIVKYTRSGKGTAVFLKDGNVIFLNISLNQFDLQMKRTSQVIAYFHQLIFNIQGSFRWLVNKSCKTNKTTENDYDSFD